MIDPARKDPNCTGDARTCPAHRKQADDAEERAREFWRQWDDDGEPGQGAVEAVVELIRAERSRLTEADTSAFERSLRIAELEAWQSVAVDSNKAIEKYLREKCPALPEEYGMPLDAVRIVVSGLEAENKHLKRDVFTRLLDEAQERYPIGSKVPREEIIAWLDTRLVHWK